MTVRTAFVRLGSDKAGTTTLSRLIKDNRAVFERHGLYVPTGNCAGLLDFLVKTHRLDEISHFSSIPGISPESKLHHWVCDFVENYNTIESNIFLTTEVFWGRLINKDVDEHREQIAILCNSIKSLLYNHQIKILLNLRRPDLYFESLFCQEVKRGSMAGAKGITNLILKKNSRNWYSLLLLIEEAFGKNNVIVKPFESEKMVDGDFIHDTLNILGLYYAKDEFHSHITNERLHRALVETLMGLNVSEGKQLSNGKLLVISDFIKNKTNLIDNKYFLSYEERCNCLKEYEQFSNYVSGAYTGGTPFFAEKLPAVGAEEYTLTEEQCELITRLIHNVRDNGLSALTDKEDIGIN